MTVRTAELLMAITMGAFSIYLMYKSTELEIGWIEDEGPGGGAWPFWLSAVMLISCLGILYNWFRRKGRIASSDKIYIESHVLGDVTSVTVALVITVGLFSFIGIYAPILSQLHGQGKVSEMSHLYRLVSRWLVTFAIPISLIFLLYPAKVMLLFGPDYVASAPVLVLLTCATFIQAAMGAAGPALSMAGYTRLVLWNSLGAFILNVILNIILIPRYGILGAAWGTMLSLTAIGLARVIEVRLIMKISFLTKGLIKPVLAGAVTWWALHLVQPFVMNYHTLVTLTIVCLVSVVVFGTLLWILKFEPEDRDFWIGLGILKKSIKK